MLLSTPMPLLHVKYGSASFFMPFRANDTVLALRIACELKLNKHDAFQIVNLQTRQLLDDDSMKISAAFPDDD